MFEKGKSGNPSGRKPIPPELRKEFVGTCPEVLDFWKKIMRDASEKTVDRIRASENIFNRTYGTPVAAIDIEANTNRKRIDLSGIKDDQLDVLIDAVTSIVEVPESDNEQETEE